jgi:hypothetical protein
VFNAGLLAEVSTLPKGLAAGQDDQGFWGFLGSRANAELVP